MQGAFPRFHPIRTGEVEGLMTRRASGENISDVLGTETRFNLPGTASDANWSQRLDKSLSSFLADPATAPKFAFLREEIEKSGRAPK